MFLFLWTRSNFSLFKVWKASLRRLTYQCSATTNQSWLSSDSTNQSSAVLKKIRAWLTWGSINHSFTYLKWNNQSLTYKKVPRAKRCVYLPSAWFQHKVGKHISSCIVIGGVNTGHGKEYAEHIIMLNRYNYLSQLFQISKFATNSWDALIPAGCLNRWTIISHLVLGTIGGI